MSQASQILGAVLEGLELVGDRAGRQHFAPVGFVVDADDVAVRRSTRPAAGRSRGRRWRPAGTDDVGEFGVRGPRTPGLCQACCTERRHAVGRQFAGGDQVPPVGGLDQHGHARRRASCRAPATSPATKTRSRRAKPVGLTSSRSPPTLRGETRQGLRRARRSASRCTSAYCCCDSSYTWPDAAAGDDIVKLVQADQLPGLGEFRRVAIAGSSWLANAARNSASCSRNSLLRLARLLRAWVV